METPGTHIHIAPYQEYGHNPYLKQAVTIITSQQMKPAIQFCWERERDRENLPWAQVGHMQWEVHMVQEHHHVVRSHNAYQKVRMALHSLQTFQGAVVEELQHHQNKKVVDDQKQGD